MYVCVCVFACAGEVQDEFFVLTIGATQGWVRDCKSATGGTDRGLPLDPACRPRDGRAVLLSVFAGCLHCSCSWEGCVFVALTRAVSNKVTSAL